MAAALTPKQRAQRLVEKGLRLHKRGDLPAAYQKYLDATAIVPNFPDAMNLLGVVLNRIGKTEEALSCANSAVAARPLPSYLSNRAVILIATGQFAAAEKDLLAAYAQAKQDAGVITNLLSVWARQKKFAPLEKFLPKVKRVIAGNADALNNVASLYMENGQLDTALDWLRKALALAPRHTLALSNLLRLAMYTRRADLAQSVIRPLMEEGDIDPRLHIELAWLEMALGNPEAGRAMLAQSLRSAQVSDLLLVLDTPEHLNAVLAVIDQIEQDERYPEVLGLLARLEQAACQYREQVAKIAASEEEQAQENLQVIRNNFAATLFRWGRYAEAATVYKRALAESTIRPTTQAMILRNYGNALTILDQEEAAQDCYQQAFALEPDNLQAWVNLFRMGLNLADWQNLENLRQKILAAPPGATYFSDAFSVMSIAHRADWQYRYAVAASQDFYQNAPRLDRTQNRKASNGKIRLGYLSRDFRCHPLATLTGRLYALHDRSQFDVLAYSYGEDDGSAERERIKNSVDQFIDCQTWTKREIAQNIHDAGIDILVDLTGNTRNTRSALLAARPAPVQAHWLGYLATMGSACYDYIISDHFVIPPQFDHYYAEGAVVRLPPSFQINDPQRPVTPLTPTRQALGLPEDAFVFCNFCQTYKIYPEIFSTWMRILQAVPGSVLWLAPGKKTACDNLRHAAAQAGVAAERLVFAERASLYDYPARYRLVDLVLDTTPVSSGATAFDILAEGCPMLALPGETFSSRIGASALLACDLPQLVMQSHADYAAKAIALATTGQAELAALRAHLENGRHTLPYFDTPRFVRTLEVAYQEMHARRLAGLPPAAINR